MAYPPEAQPRFAFRIADGRRPLLDGAGAMLYGGRWNSPGRRIIYAAETYAGALLETLVHTNTGRVPRHHAWIRITIPPGVVVEEVDPASVPGWDHPGLSASRAVGDGWYDSGRSAVLAVPSVVAPPDRNLLIHQEHPDFSRILASSPLPVVWDMRLIGR